MRNNGPRPVCSAETGTPKILICFESDDTKYLVSLWYKSGSQDGQARMLHAPLFTPLNHFLGDDSLLCIPVFMAS